MSLSKPQRLRGPTSAATEGIPWKNRRALWLEATTMAIAQNITSRLPSQRLSAEFTQPLFPPTPRKCCRRKKDVRADCPKPAPAAQPQAGGMTKAALWRARGGQLSPACAGEPAPQRSGCACRASRSQGQLSYLLPRVRRCNSRNMGKRGGLLHCCLVRKNKKCTTLKSCN